MVKKGWGNLRGKIKGAGKKAVVVKKMQGGETKPDLQSEGAGIQTDASATSFLPEWLLRAFDLTGMFWSPKCLAGIRHPRPRSPFLSVPYKITEYARAIDEFSERLRGRPSDVSLWISRAEARMHEWQLDGAIDDCVEALRLDPTNADAMVIRGWANLRKQKLEVAIQEFNHALEARPSDVDSMAMLASIALWLGKLDEAIFHSHKYLYLCSSDPAVWLLRGEAQLQNGMYDQASTDCSEALRMRGEHHTTALSIRAEAAFRNGDHCGAMSDCCEALRLDPNCVRALTMRASLWFKHGEYKKAIVDCDQSLLFDQSVANATAWSIRGGAKLRIGDYEGAISDCHESIALDPMDGVTFAIRGCARVQVEDLDAVEDFEEAFRLEPLLCKPGWQETGGIGALCEDLGDSAVVALPDRSISVREEMRFTKELPKFHRHKESSVTLHTYLSDTSTINHLHQIAVKSDVLFNQALAHKPTYLSVEAGDM